jgi:hypothetical protein
MTPEELRKALRIPEGATIEQLHESRCPAESASHGKAASAARLEAEDFGRLFPVPEVPGLALARHAEDPRVVLVQAAALPVDEDGAVGDVRFEGEGEVRLDPRRGAAALRLLLDGRVVWVVNDSGNVEVVGLGLLPFETRRAVEAASSIALVAPDPRAILTGLAIQDSILSRVDDLATQSPLHALAALGLALRAWRPSEPKAQLAALLAGKPIEGVASRVDAWLHALDSPTLAAWGAWASGFAEDWSERACAANAASDPQLLEDRDTCESLQAVLGRRLPVDQVGDCAAGDAALNGHPELAWDAARGELVWLDEVYALDPDAWWAAPEHRP